MNNVSVDLIHLEDLLKINKRTWVKLEDKFRKELIKKACNGKSLYTFSKRMHQFVGLRQNEVYAWYNGERLNNTATKKIEHGMPLNNLVYLAKLANIEMEEVEKHTEFIKGDSRAGKIFRPKFPIKLNKAVSAAIGHILHDGYLAQGRLRVVYANKEADNLEHFKRNVTKMFNASKIEFGEIESKGGIRIDVPNIAGYIFVLFGLQPGDKLKNDTGVPQCLLKSQNTEIIGGFIESTIADEMCVRNHKKQVGGNIGIILNSIKNEPPKLLLDDMVMFKKLGTKPTKPRLERIKRTKQGENRYSWRFFICGQRNLSKLASLIKIPTKRKQEALIEAVESYARPTDAILLNENLRVKLFNKALLEHKTMTKLSKFLTIKLHFNISECSLNEWKKGRYHCPVSVVLKLANICNYPLKDIIENTLTCKSHKMEKPFNPKTEFLNEVITSCNKI